jgi:hypothetical protein
MDVALASCVELPEPDPDEAPLLEALEAAGLEAVVLAWDDPRADWSAARMTLLRATWNYPYRPGAFRRWLETTATVTKLWNPLPMVRWNLHKRYLLELEGAGLAVTPTELVSRGAPRPLADILRSRGWEQVVIKPAVSASSYRTHRFPAGQWRTGDEHLRRLAGDGDALVQSYLPAVETYGERALIWIDGELTHAVRKSPRFGDEAEATSGALPISDDERGLADSAMAWVSERFGESPMYARIDLAPGPSGDPLLMELELIEPSLYFGQSARALSCFVEAVRRRLAR